eukprot:GHVQ01027057.1.p2 GENE.GHVQ01027057.1~~GHVQ01027057.1.p2  ORF type:complete len:225 (-),score=21.48 GHVQ01027057.1:3343-4017(-)
MVATEVDSMELCSDVTGKEEVSSGTTIIACAFDGGVVLAADTRTSAGSYIVNRASRKISMLHNRVFACRSGSAADTQAITNIVKRNLAEHAQELGHDQFPRVKTAAKLFQLICYEYKHVLTAGIVVAGWDKRYGGQVFSIPIGGTMLEVPYAAGGSGSVYISAFMDSVYKPGMTKEQCQDFVKRSVAHAIARDGVSGGMIRTVTITEAGVEEDCVLGNELPFNL